MALIMSKNGHSPLTNMSRFGLRLILGRWFMVFASLLIMSVAGAGYLFGLYSNELKSVMGYDQSTLNLLSFFKDMGGNVGVFSGLINEVTPPWVVLSIGAAMNFFGYFMIWLGVTGRLRHVPVWQMCIYICLGANSQSFANTGALVTCVKNFPKSRGIVIGLLKGFLGLSGAILTLLYHTFFYGEDSKSFILFVGWLPAVVSLVFLRTIRVLDVVHQQNEVKVFYDLLYISLALAGFLMALIVVQIKFAFTQAEYYVSTFIVVFLLLIPLAVVAREEHHLRRRNDEPLENESSLEVITQDTTKPQQIEPLNDDKEAQNTSCLKNIFNPPNRGEDYTILQALFSIDMLILFIATTCGIGGTLTAIDNLGQIGTALGYSSDSITTFVSLISIWNYLGRVVSGFASEIVLAKYKFPRPMIMTLVLLVSCVGHLLIAFGVPNSLYVASVILGFCFGANWPLVYSIISEIFGLKYYSTLYNFGAVASPVGSYVFNVVITGRLYDQEGLRQLNAKGLTRKQGEDLSCVGVNCYKMSFIIITCATLFGSLVSFILVLRTRKFYKGDIYKKFREHGTVTEAEMHEVRGNVPMAK